MDKGVHVMNQEIQVSLVLLAWCLKCKKKEIWLRKKMIREGTINNQVRWSAGTRIGNIEWRKMGKKSAEYFAWFQCRWYVWRIWKQFSDFSMKLILLGKELGRALPKGQFFHEKMFIPMEICIRNNWEYKRHHQLSGCKKCGIPK